jgi:hypothetical protein
MSRKKKKKGPSTIDRKEERLSDKRKKVPLDEMKKGVHPYGKRGRPTLSLLEPTPDQASRSPTSSTPERVRWRSWICTSESGEPRLHVRSTTKPNSGAI